MSLRRLNRPRQRRAIALLCALACPVVSASAQPVSNSALELLKQWEQIQVQHLHSQVLAAGTTASAEPALIHYLIPANGNCGNYTLTLSNLDEDKTASFEDIGGLCRVAVNTRATGVHLLQVSEADGRDNPNPVGQSSLSINADTKEVFIGLAPSNEAEQLVLRQWPSTATTATDAAWWRRVFGWLPGIASVKSLQQRDAAARPQWQWLAQQCGDSQTRPETAATLFQLRSDGDHGSYNAEEYRIMTQCALAQMLPATANEFLTSWAKIGGADSARNEARLALAQLQYRIGDYYAVVSSLKPKQFESLNRVKATHLLSMAYIALEQHSNAVSILESGPHLATQADTNLMETAGDPSLFMRYNLSSALMKAGKTDDALAVLDALGQHPSNSPYSAALIERANLALGWQFIHQGKAASAAPVFERVTLDGPFARRAALGLGWSWALAPGEKQKRVAAPVFQQHAGQSLAILRALYQSDKISCEEYRAALQDEAVCSQKQYFNQAKQESEPQRSENAINVLAYLLESDLTDMVSIETSVQLSRMLKDQSHIEPANRVLAKAIAAIQQQQKNLADWQTGTSDPQHATKAIPQEIRVWSLSAEPTLIRNTLARIARHSQAHSFTDHEQLSTLEANLQAQLNSLVQGQTQTYLANLESYLAEAYHLRGQLLDQSQHVLTTADSSGELSAKLSLK